ncbi:hypothetical protein [Saccharopolyspora pogona]|uniref:hypothetical protein n=1 Tax=Saccharopolyspora pogona TaxID=333966 RepID=UPI001682D5F0|nr:hypothetical protein [Saccharopolyspora pogona]
MRIRTDDEIYRVDAVWLGPPKATFPWRARYVAWGVGLVVFLIVLGVERRMNIGFGFFSTAWAVVITVVVTRIICSRIGHERPLGAVLVMWLRELTTPREKTSGTGGAASAARIRVKAQRPRPRKKSKRVRPQQPQQPQRPARSRQPAARGTVPSRRTRSKEVRGVRSPARP